MLFAASPFFLQPARPRFCRWRFCRTSLTENEANSPGQDTGNIGSVLLKGVLTKKSLLQASKQVKAKLPAVAAVRPNPVRHVTITKALGGMQEPGFSTVTVWLIQQALLEQLFEPMFSWHSCAFRPGRRAHERAGVAHAHALPFEVLIFFQRFCSSGAQEIHGGGLCPQRS